MRYARGSPDAWELDVIDPDGLMPAIALDAVGEPQVGYSRRTGADTASLRRARLVPGDCAGSNRQGAKHAKSGVFDRVRHLTVCRKD